VAQNSCGEMWFLFRFQNFLYLICHYNCIFAMIRIVSECFKTYIDWHIELVLFICLGNWWFPESPRWLYLHKRDSAASEQALLRLRGKNAEEEVRQELAEMKATLEAKTSSEPSSMCSVLGDRELWLPLLLVCSFQASQQLSGINAVS